MAQGRVLISAPQHVVRERFGHIYVRKFTQNARLIRSSFQRTHKQAQTEPAAHNGMDVSVQANPDESSTYMLKSIDFPSYHRNFRVNINSSLHQLVFAISLTIQQLLYNCYTTPSSQPKTNNLARSFQCLFLAPSKGIVKNNSPFTKDIKPLLSDHRLVSCTQQRQPPQELKACHRNLAAGRGLDPVLDREPALALDTSSLLHSNI